MIDWFCIKTKRFSIISFKWKKLISKSFDSFLAAILKTLSYVVDETIDLRSEQLISVLEVSIKRIKKWKKYRYIPESFIFAIEKFRLG